MKLRSNNQRSVFMFQSAWVGCGWGAGSGARLLGLNSFPWLSGWVTLDKLLNLSGFSFLIWTMAIITASILLWEEVKCLARCQAFSKNSQKVSYCCYYHKHHAHIMQEIRDCKSVKSLEETNGKEVGREVHLQPRSKGQSSLARHWASGGNARCGERLDGAGSSNLARHWGLDGFNGAWEIVSVKYMLWWKLWWQRFFWWAPQGWGIGD